jgi:hypothetical protein
MTLRLEAAQWRERSERSMDGAGGIGGGAGTVTARLREPPAQQGAGAPGPLDDRMSALGVELELLDKEHAALLATVQRLVSALKTDVDALTASGTASDKP